MKRRISWQELPRSSQEVSRNVAKNVAAITITDTIVQRMVKAKEPAHEGLKICVEQIEQLRKTEGVHGIHLMAL